MRNRAALNGVCAAEFTTNTTTKHTTRKEGSKYEKVLMGSLCVYVRMCLYECVGGTLGPKWIIAVLSSSNLTFLFPLTSLSSILQLFCQPNITFSTIFVV